MNVWVTPFREALEALDRVSAERIFNDALLTLSPIEAIEEVAMPALEFMGAAWESGELALSQIYMSGRISESLIEQVLPPLTMFADSPDSSRPAESSWTDARRDQVCETVLYIEPQSIYGKLTEHDRTQ